MMDIAEAIKYFEDAVASAAKGMVNQPGIAACNMAIAALREQEQSKWISVKERLPEEHDSIWAKLYGTKSWQPGLFRKCSDTVIACAERKDGRRRVVAIGMYDGKWDWHKLQDNEQVTHWMPLPEPPKEGAEG